MDLVAKQAAFAQMLAKLLIWADEQGYIVTLGEAYRTPQQAAANAAAGRGIRDSLHVQRLAMDLCLFRDGYYCIDSRDYEPLGKYWESLGGSWGGRFSPPDGNHFSLAHEGRR